MISTHIPASLDQEIITGLFKLLKLGPGTAKHELLLRVPKGERKPPDLHHPTPAPLVQASVRSGHPSSHRNSAGLLGWRAWMLSYFIQPESFSEVQMSKLYEDWDSSSMKHCNLFIFQRTFIEHLL